MKLTTPSLLISLAAQCCVPAASQNVSGWLPDPGHPQVQYRIKCYRGGTTVEWRSDYPGEVSLKANIRGDGYDGGENVTIPPGGTAASDVDTLNCSPGAFRVSVNQFAMKPPPPKPAGAPQKAAAPEPPVILIPPYQPPQKMSEVSAEALSAIRVGMRKEDVLQALGQPASKLAIPEDTQLIETYRYRVVADKAGVIRFSNGVVTEISAQ